MVGDEGKEETSGLKVYILSRLSKVTKRIDMLDFHFGKCIFHIWELPDGLTPSNVKENASLQAKIVPPKKNMSQVDKTSVQEERASIFAADWPTPLRRHKRFTEDFVE